MNEENNNVPEEELDNIIILNDENGEEVPFEFLDLIELDGEEYVVLLPVEDDENEDAEGEVVILKVEDTESEEEESYVSVEDEEVLNKVIADNPQAVADYKGGKEKALGALVGQTMKAMKGKANPGQVNQKLKEMLK